MSKNFDLKNKQLPVREITLRGIVLGIILAVIFTASNVYMGLKVGITFATSIPAAVISMSIFKIFKNNNILENNIVQTIASVGSLLGAMVFVIPALIIIGYWQEVPLWEVFALCAIGSTLGILYTVPLRRSLVINSDLKYPEGTACAHVLKLACDEVNDDGIIIKTNKGKMSSTSKGMDILLGGISAILVSIGQEAIKIFSSMASYVTSLNGALFSISTKFSPSLIAAGYLVGSNGAINFFIGYIISLSLMAYLSLYDPVIISAIDANNLYMNLVMKLWSEKIRYVGVGFMGIASFWTIIKLIKPLIQGVRSSYESFSKYKESGRIKRIDHDIPMNYIISISLFLVLPTLFLFYHFITQSGLNSIALLLILVILSYLISFIISAAAGYMAGLVGSSYTPISGMIIVATLIITLAVILFANYYDLDLSRGDNKPLMAMVLLALSFILSVGALANDNLQDLKTGQLVKATPYKQQITLILGTISGSAVVGYVIQILYDAYGFVGAMPREGMDQSAALIAPQANLINSIIKGLFVGNLDWSMINLGGILAIIVIFLSLLLKKHLKLYPLAMAIAIYLPPQYVLSIILGGTLSYIVNYISRKKKYSKGDANDRATLVVSGLIVGESIFGIIFAFWLTYSTGNSHIDININDSLQNFLGILAFLSMFFLIWQRAFSKK